MYIVFIFSLAGHMNRKHPDFIRKDLLKEAEKKLATEIDNKEAITSHFKPVPPGKDFPLAYICLVYIYMYNFFCILTRSDPDFINVYYS